MKTFLFTILLITPVFAKSQLIEQFSDGDFTNNPVWAGTTSDFTVNGAGQLQTNASAASTSYLSTPNLLTDLADKEWRFQLRQNFAGSATNYTRIFLTADDPSFTNVQNGYFLLFGEAGSNDAVKLYKITSGASSLILTGTSGAVANAFTLGLKIVHRASGEWMLYIDYTGGNNYSQEATATDINTNAAPYFGIYCTYTVSNIRKIYLDDIYVGAEQSDNIAPNITTVNVLNNQSVRVTFTEPVDHAIESQTVSSAPGLIQSSIVQETNPAVVTFLFSTGFTNGTTYQVTIPSVRDVSGNDTTITFEFTYLIAEMPSEGDVIINEVMADPTPTAGLPEYDFVEIYNRSNKYFNLQGWKIGDNAGYGTISSSVWLFPGEYKIITSATAAPHFTNAITASSFPAYNNNYDDVILQDNNGNIIDKISYTIDWYKDNSKKDGGYTLERINPEAVCSDMNNWKASDAVSGGTPGAINSVFDNSPDIAAPQIDTIIVVDLNTLSVKVNEIIPGSTISQIVVNTTPSMNITGITQNPADRSLLTISLSTPITANVIYIVELQQLEDCAGNSGSSSKSFIHMVSDIPVPGDIIINEVMADSTPTAGLPEYDFVEIYNRSNKYFNIQGWKIGDNAGYGTISSSVWLFPGEYKIITSATAAPHFTNAITASSFPAYNNNYDDVILQDNNGNILDKISYTIDWYKDNSKKDGGYTLERINPDVVCSDMNNWKASDAVSGGTPGTINSVFDNSPDITAPQIDTILVVDLNTLSVKVNEIIPGSTISQIVVNTTPSMDITGITQDSADLSFFTISLSTPITTNTNYILELQQLEDCSGNRGNSSKYFIHWVSDVPSEGDVIITEFMADPTPVVGLPEVEYVEIYNKSSKYFNITGWKIGDNSSFGTIASGWIAPSEYKVIASTTNATLFSNGIGATSFPSYGNAGDDIILKDHSGMLLDQVSYTDGWYKEDVKKDGGYSLERIRLNISCSDEFNWKASENLSGGTPGIVNSVNDNSPDTIAPVLLSAIPLSDSVVAVQFTEPLGANWTTMLFELSPTLTIEDVSKDPANRARFYIRLNGHLIPSVNYTLKVQSIEDCQGNITAEDQIVFILADIPVSGEIIINELLFNPLTGGSDFIELKNISNKTFNLRGLQLTNTKSGASNNKIIAADYYLLPDAITVLTPDTSFQKQNYPFHGTGNYIQMAIPPMNNDVSTIRLFLDSLTTIDSLTYSEKWHFQLLDDKKGKSLERISFDAPSTVSSSWHTASESAGFATPGLENSQNTAYLYSGKLTLSSETISPDNDGFEDYLILTYEMDKTGYVGSVKIYDDRGRDSRSLVKNELLGATGIFSWDGLDDDLKKASVGTYVIIFDGYHLDSGETFKMKKVVVVAGDR
ncbi:MAG: lamin tail domain-containing protein [Flavobacteriia bacterium]|nr:lamin tail domain-containing protein [Flavobacteriia bacterium]